ncbi:MAG: hypothetical protein WAU58_05400 [Terriglobales bacterium]
MSRISKRSVFQDGLNKVTRSGRGSALLAGAIVTALVTLCFLMPFWNRFLGLRSGDGGFTGGVFFLNGMLPYRDYYYPTPPLFVFRSAAVLAIFGKLPIVMRGFGVFERVVLSLLLYGWLVRFFRVKDAALAALVTVVVSTGDYADPVSSYHHFAIMLAIASGLAASYAVDEGRTKRVLTAIGCLAGILSQLCLDSYQTIGLGVTFAIPVVVGLCLIRLEGVRKAMQFLAGFAAGWLFAAGVLLSWMAHFGILRAFLTQAFIVGPAAKASRPGDFLLHAMVGLKFYYWAALIAVVILAISWGPFRRSENAERKDSDRDSLRGVGLALVLGLGATVIPLAVGFPWKSRLLQRVATTAAAKPTIYASLFGSGLLLFYYAWRFVSRTLTRRQSQLALFASIAFTVAFMTSLSFPAFEAMVVPGFALILVVLLNDFEDWRRLAVYAVCGLLLLCETQFKERCPFGFGGWLEPPVKYATTRSSLPELRGFLLPPDIVDLVDSTIRAVREYGDRNDTIFAFPELAFFYGATERRPATLSGSHNMDLVSDSFARQEAERLLQARPAVLIYAPVSESVLRSDEEFWRNGKPSGQRDLIASIEALAREYKLVRAFDLPSYGNRVYVFVRPDRQLRGQ